MPEKELRLFHLLRVRGLGRRRIRQLLRIDPQLTSIYQLSVNELQTLLKLPSPTIDKIHNDLHSSQIISSIKYDYSQTNMISIYNPLYPQLLKMIPDPPLCLYAKGNLDYLNHEPKLSVVGTRAHSQEAERKVQYLFKPLIQHDWLIVSGMAKGIDKLSHQAALAYNGKTIAVLGFGFHHIYPKENIHIMNTIGRNHLLLSEYPPHTKPKPWHFPERNRIISGLSFGSLIIEAKEKSGTFITAEQALEQGREVFVVPGSILSPQTKGCHLLIQEGATLIYDSTDLIQAWKTTKISV
ncbi:DNA-protecting protein DprA [Salinibacillus xinjiangensis]|uniref:DNA-protecting protein DprA n=1 Tax=Salinibacillus xinjiangensis TaxID=1229268 RepID=A0A6G1X384_9BACI|nr:DNA-protecting protein DprA [Salinibacillus xinjiangensis]